MSEEEELSNKTPAAKNYCNEDGCCKKMKISSSDPNEYIPYHDILGMYHNVECIDCQGVKFSAYELKVNNELTYYILSYSSHGNVDSLFLWWNPDYCQKPL